MAEERDLVQEMVDEATLGTPPEEPEEDDAQDPPQRQARDGGVSSRQVFLSCLTVFLISVAASVYLFTVADERILDLGKELAAKADAAVVAGEIARLDSAKAERSELAEVRDAVGVLTAVSNTLNSRVVAAEENLRKNRAAAAAAAGSAKKAAQTAEQARNELARLDRESRERWTGTTRLLDSLRADLPREVDSRVGPVAVELSTFRAEQTAVNAAADSAVNAFRQKLRLSDKDMARLAAAFSERRSRQSNSR